MEITIDLAAVQRIASAEYRDARTELRALGSVATLRNSQARHDARLAAAPDADTLACGQGCSWCCHFTVDIRPVEALTILEFVAASFTPLELRTLQSRLAANAQLVGGLDEEQRMQRNVECAFLRQGRCSIYPVRPQTCRNYHATDAAGCRRSYEQPDDLDIDPEFAPHVYQAGGATKGRSARSRQWQARTYPLRSSRPTCSRTWSKARRSKWSDQDTKPASVHEPPDCR